RLERDHQLPQHGQRVSRGGRHAESFLADGHGGIVDGLDVNVVLLEKLVGRLLGELRVADEDGDDVGGVGDYGNVNLVEHLLEGASVELLEDAVSAVACLVFNGGAGAS